MTYLPSRQGSLQRRLIPEATIRADLLWMMKMSECFPKQVIWDVLRDIATRVRAMFFEQAVRGGRTDLQDLYLPFFHFLQGVLHYKEAYEEEQSTSPHSSAASLAREAQGTPTHSASHKSSKCCSYLKCCSFPKCCSFFTYWLSNKVLHLPWTVNTQGTADIQRTLTSKVTAEPHDAASIPKSPNDYTPTDVFQTQAQEIVQFRPASGSNHHALWVENQNLKKQKRRRKKHKKKVSSVKLGRNKDEGTLSEEHNVQEEDTTHPFFDDIADQDAAVTPDLERKSDETEEVNIEEKEASNVKSGETEELDLETTQSTARQGTITPRTLNFEDEAGPSSPLRTISRPRGLSIPGPIQSQPQQPTQGTDTKDKGKGILVEEPKKKLTFQQIRALELQMMMSATLEIEDGHYDHMLAERRKPLSSRDDDKDLEHGMK
ncbi:hypothetical protein Tco_1192402 [Tanacetum coccineum]